VSEKKLDIKICSNDLLQYGEKVTEIKRIKTIRLFYMRIVEFFQL